MTYVFRPSHYNVTDSATARVYEPGGAELPWWNPSGVGTCVAAYQAKGAASYAASLVNLANPGVNNLVEGNGAVSWAAGTGWSFAAAQLKYFIGPVPTISNPPTWTLIVQYSVTIANVCVVGCYTPWVNGMQINPNQAIGRVQYSNGLSLTVVPALAAGNLGVAGSTAYRNGIPDGIIPTGNGAAVPPLTIGCLNLGGFANFMTGNVAAAALYSSVLDAPTMLILAPAMAAL